MPTAARAIPDPASLHPDIWRGAQLARASYRCVHTGFAALSAQLPGAGWPQGALTELMVQQAGIGEMRLLQPALATLREQSIVLLQPPHRPQGMGWMGWQCDPARLMWVRAGKTADALWSAEQILRNGSCGALIFWQDQIRPEALRRLHLAAQSCEALFFVMRPLQAARDASPAPLRLTLTPAPGGARITIVKRRGSLYDTPIELRFDTPAIASPLPANPGLPLTAKKEYASLDRPLLPTSEPGRIPANVAG